jgi:hypothetical protein
MILHDSPLKNSWSDVSLEFQIYRHLSLLKMGGPDPLRQFRSLVHSTSKFLNFMKSEGLRELTFMKLTCIQILSILHAQIQQLVSVFLLYTLLLFWT